MTTTFNSQVFLEDFFEATVDRQPDSVAVDDDGETVTYAALDGRANRISHWLRNQGCKPNDRVCLFTGKNANAYAAVLGILKGGSCWVPLSEQMPDHRLEFLLRSIEPMAAIVEPAQKDRLARAMAAVGQTIPTLELGGAGESALADQLADRPSRDGRTTDDLAYIIFTSGSTGEPKGVMVQHRNIAHFLSLCTDYFKIVPGSRFAHHSELTFDPSLFDLFHCWSCGGALVPFNKRSYRINPGKFVKDAKINVWFSVPSAISSIAKAGQIGDPDMACLKHLLLTGESIPPKLARAWMDAYPDTRLYNVYGTTETAIISHWYTLPDDFDPERPVPVGTVLPGIRVMLMDGGMEVPPGEIGESVVMGPQLSPGYWRNEAESAARFVTNPIDPTLPQKAYRTGDLLCQRFDGVFEYVGRADSQVKVRGHRVELAEVEAAFLRCHGVEEVAVLLDKPEENPDEGRLAAFIATSEVMDGEALKAVVGQDLPSYMIPTDIIFVPGELPKSVNQKVDKKALQARLSRNATKAKQG